LSPAVKATGLAALLVLALAPSARADDPVKPAPDPIATATEPQPPAEPRVPVTTPQPVEREPTAADTAEAPVPGDESGRLDRVDPGDSGFRMLARAALWVPRVVTEAVLSPVRGSVWAYDRFQLYDVYYRVFWNDARTIGLYPTATYMTGFGLTAGAKFVMLDLFGHHEQLAMHATVGGTYHLGNSIALRSGDRYDGVKIGIDGNFDRRPGDSFYGIGNGNGTSPPPTMLIDPITDPTAVHTEYRYQELRAAAFANIRLVDDLGLVVHGAITNIKTSRGTVGTATEDVYNPMDVPGYGDTLTHGYGELELRWDTRRDVSRWEPHSTHADGSLVSGFAGYVVGIDNSPDFWHYGVDLQHYFRIAQGPRVIGLRFHGDGVSGSIAEIPFVELPYLGGDTFLRGYDFQRFRDRVAAVASAHYLWDVTPYLDAYLFVDAGRVYSGVDNITLDGLRAGYGFGLKAHDDTGGFIFEGNIASSIDGGLFLNVSFNPVLDARARWR
jgi:hypothetical protein